MVGQRKQNTYALEGGLQDAVKSPVSLGQPRGALSLLAWCAQDSRPGHGDQSLTCAGCPA